MEISFEINRELKWLEEDEEVVVEPSSGYVTAFMQT